MPRNTDYFSSEHLVSLWVLHIHSLSRQVTLAFLVREIFFCEQMGVCSAPPECFWARDWRLKPPHCSFAEIYEDINTPSKTQHQKLSNLKDQGPRLILVHQRLLLTSSIWLINVKKDWKGPTEFPVTHKLVNDTLVKIHQKMASKTVTAKLETRHLTEHSLSYLTKMPVVSSNSFKFPAPISSGQKSVLPKNEEGDTAGLNLGLLQHRKNEVCPFFGWG